MEQLSGDGGGAYEFPREQPGKCIKEMLPWFFAHDHTNYVRYLPVYLAHVMSLPETQAEAHALLEHGDFGVQRTKSRGFSQMLVDQTIEQTLNRSTKTKEGIVGLSLRKGAVQRWMITAHSRAAFVEKCQKTSTGGEERQRRLNKESGSARMKRDKEDFKKVVEVISNWRNPFEPSEELLCTSSGYVTSDNIKQDLPQAKEKGATALTPFVEERIITNSTGIFETLPKLKLGSFRDTHKKTSVTAGDRNVMMSRQKPFCPTACHWTEPPDGPEISAVSRDWPSPLVFSFTQCLISQDKQSQSVYATRKWCRMPAELTWSDNSCHHRCNSDATDTGQGA